VLACPAWRTASTVMLSDPSIIPPPPLLRNPRLQLRSAVTLSSLTCKVPAYKARPAPPYTWALFPLNFPFPHPSRRGSPPLTIVLSEFLPCSVTNFSPECVLPPPHVFVITSSPTKLPPVKARSNVVPVKTRSSLPP